MNNLLVKPRIKKTRFRVITESEAKARPGLYISDHVADRIMERHMAKDIPFIAMITKYFYDNVFKTTTFNSRLYKVGFRGLFVCFRVQRGAVSNERKLILTTTFEGDQEYFCDETIILKKDV